MTTERSESEQRANLEELREELGVTVTELAHRADVPSRVRARRDDALAQARAVFEQVKTVVAEKAPALRSAAQQPPAIAGAAVLLLLLALRRRRRNRRASR
jgi:uncharacterized protein (TIGR03382 family)